MHVIVGKEAVTEGRGFNDVQNRKGVVEAEPGSRVAVEQLGPSTSPSKVMYPRWCVFFSFNVDELFYSSKFGNVVTTTNCHCGFLSHNGEKGDFAGRRAVFSSD